MISTIHVDLFCLCVGVVCLQGNEVRGRGGLRLEGYRINISDHNNCQKGTFIFVLDSYCLVNGKQAVL